MGPVGHCALIEGGHERDPQRRGALGAGVAEARRLVREGDRYPDQVTVELPAAGGIGTARSIARAYAAFAGVGSELGLARRTLEELWAPPHRPVRGWRDEVLKVDTAFSFGFIKPTPEFRFGTSARAFGHPGAGGSFAYFDPDRELAFAYTPNRLGFHLVDDPRERRLRDAVVRCLS